MKKNRFLERFLNETRGGKILDLGCGDNKVLGSFGVDIIQRKSGDLIHDLNNFPWPLQDNHFDAVILKHVIEHLRDIPRIMDEILRVCKNGAYVYIETPHYTNNDSWGDPCHIWHLNTTSMLQFVGKGRPTYEQLFCYVTLRSKFKKIGFEWIINMTNKYPNSKFWENRRYIWENRHSFLIRGGTIYFFLKVIK